MTIEIAIFLFMLLLLAAFYTLWILDKRIEFVEQCPNLSMDPFFTNLSKYDLYALGVKTPRDYWIKYYKNVRPFTIEEKFVLTKLTHIATEKLEIWTELDKIKWKFMRTRLSINPHTIGGASGYIVIPDIFFEPDVDDELLIKFLIHEKIHIWQKRNISATADLIESWGFKPSKIKHPLARSNPDCDTHAYTFETGNELMALGAIYTSELPTNIGDITQIFQADDVFSEHVVDTSHPLEIMAYELTEIIYSGIEFAEFSPGLDPEITCQWMEENLG